MGRITLDLIRKKAEHHDGLLEVSVEAESATLPAAAVGQF
jgi:hypothetical protein